MDELPLDELEKRVNAFYQAEKQTFLSALSAYAPHTPDERKAIDESVEQAKEDSNILFYQSHLPKGLVPFKTRFSLALELQKHAYWRSHKILIDVYDKINDGDEIGKLIIEKAKHGDPWRGFTQDYGFIFLDIVHTNSPIAHLVDEKLRAKALNEALWEVLAFFERRNVNIQSKNEELDIILSKHMHELDFSYGPRKVKALPKLDLGDCYVDNLYFRWWVKQQELLEPEDAAKLLAYYLEPRLMSDELWDIDDRKSLKTLLSLPEIKKYSETKKFKEMIRSCLRAHMECNEQNQLAIDELILMAEKPEQVIELAIGDLAECHGIQSLLELRLPRRLITAKARRVIEEALLKDKKQVYWAKTHLAGGLRDIYQAIKLGYFSEQLGRETVTKELQEYISQKRRPAAAVAEAALAYADKGLFGEEFATTLATRAIADLVIRKAHEKAHQKIVNAKQAGIFSRDLFGQYLAGSKIAFQLPSLGIS